MKYILVTFIIFCSAVNSFSQIPLGFKAGINVNQVKTRNSASGIPTGEFRTGTSFHVGLFTDIKLSSKFRLIPELQYIDKKSALELRYIEVPLLISYSPVSWLGIEAGGSYGWNIYNGDIDIYNEPDGGVLGGLRFSYSQWSFLMRYYYGITSIHQLKLAVPPHGDEFTLRECNENMQFSLTYYLRKPKKI